MLSACNFAGKPVIVARVVSSLLTYAMSCTACALVAIVMSTVRPNLQREDHTLLLDHLCSSTTSCRPYHIAVHPGIAGRHYD